MTGAIHSGAFMGGVGIGLSVVFVVLLLVLGADVIRRMLGD